MAISRFELDSSSNVVEVAANDGYLLQYFAKTGIPNYGVEPTKSTASAAREREIDIVEDFFGERLAEQLKCQRGQSDLMIGNNVLAHVPDINDFVMGFAVLLKPDGVATFEFPHLMQLVANNQFDTVYHEHFSYLSLTFVSRLMSSVGLEVFDADEIKTHGGSLRVYCQKKSTGIHEINADVALLLDREIKAGIKSKSFYSGFQPKIDRVKDEFLSFLHSVKSKGLKIAAYGAAAKGNTFLNYLQLTKNDIEYVIDLNPAKQGKFLPGSHIPIYNEQFLIDHKPDFIIVLPWNLIDEIRIQLRYTNDWGAKIVTALPDLKIYEGE